MLSHHEKQSVINILDDILGVGTSMKNDEQAHYCPFCHHHKKKLQINLKTQKWHCWVCDAKGKRIQRLLKRLNVDSRKLKKILENITLDNMKLIIRKIVISILPYIMMLP